MVLSQVINNTPNPQTETTTTQHIPSDDEFRLELMALHDDVDDDVNFYFEITPAELDELTAMTEEDMIMNDDECSGESSSEEKFPPLSIVSDDSNVDEEFYMDGDDNDIDGMFYNCHDDEGQCSSSNEDKPSTPETSSTPQSCCSPIHHHKNIHYYSPQQFNQALHRFTMSMQRSEYTRTQIKLSTIMKPMSVMDSNRPKVSSMNSVADLLSGRRTSLTSALEISRSHLRTFSTRLNSFAA